MKIISVFLLSFALSFLQGCKTVSDIYLTDGDEEYHISCNGSDMRTPNCFEKAEEKCGDRGYEVTEQPGDDQIFLKCK